MTCGIYKITNKINGKCYVGQSIDIEKRWRRHKNTAFKVQSELYEYPLYRAIRKYGLENFNFVVIEETSKDLLDDREKYWIKYFNSFMDGYNQTAGGQGASKHGTKITYEQWLSIVEMLEQEQSNLAIGTKYGISDQTVSDINNGKTWYDDSIQYPIRQAKKRAEKHCPYCGKRIYYKSKTCKDCAPQKSFSEKATAKAALANSKAVLKLSLEGNIIQRYTSAVEAAKDIDATQIKSVSAGIRRAIRKYYFTGSGVAYGYMWRQESQDERLNQNLRRYDYSDIYQEYLKTKSISATAKQLGCSPETVKTAIISLGVSIEEIQNSKKENARRRLGKKVGMFDENDVLIRTFDSVNMAEKELGIRHQSILKVCHGGAKTTHGYKWKFIDENENF